MTEMSHAGIPRPGLVARPAGAHDPPVIRRPTDQVPQATYQDLARAIEHCERDGGYQPTVRRADAMVTGFEALVRWRHPELGVLPAASFLSLAEDCGLVH